MLFKDIVSTIHSINLSQFFYLTNLVANVDAKLSIKKVRNIGKK